jgi:uncharacterized protein involved in cysteine biosynthesis
LLLVENILYVERRENTRNAMFEKMMRGIGMPMGCFSYISENNLWGYTVFPLLVTAALVAVISFVLWVYVFSALSGWLAVDVATWPSLFRWLFSAFHFIMKIVLFYLLFSLILRIYLTLFAIVVIPFLSPLVEKILQREGIDTLQIKGAEIIGFIIGSIFYNLKILIWQLLISLVLLLTGPLQPFLNFGFSSYFLGRSYFDYVFEMLGRPREFSNMAKRFRSEAMGLGIFSSMIVFIPVLGAIFAPVLCVVAATRLYAEKANAPAAAT